MPRQAYVPIPVMACRDDDDDEEEEEEERDDDDDEDDHDDDDDGDGQEKVSLSKLRVLFGLPTEVQCAEGISCISPFGYYSHTWPLRVLVGALS